MARVDEDAETVLYNDLSGDTHLLTAPATTLLHLLAQGPATSAALGEAMGRAFDLAPGAGLDADLAGLLDDLRRFGLIHTIDNCSRLDNRDNPDNRANPGNPC